MVIEIHKGKQTVIFKLYACNFEKHGSFPLHHIKLPVIIPYISKCVAYILYILYMFLAEEAQQIAIPSNNVPCRHKVLGCLCGMLEYNACSRFAYVLFMLFDIINETKSSRICITLINITFVVDFSRKWIFSDYIQLLRVIDLVST